MNDKLTGGGGCHPTPLRWMGSTIRQNQCLRFLDRENPYGEIMAVKAFGSSGLTVTDAYCIEHTLVALPDGTVCVLDEGYDSPEDQSRRESGVNSQRSGEFCRADSLRPFSKGIEGPRLVPEDQRREAAV